jgi:hypothetical protein
MGGALQSAQAVARMGSIIAILEVHVGRAPPAIFAVGTVPKAMLTEDALRPAMPIAATVDIAQTRVILAGQSSSPLGHAAGLVTSLHGAEVAFRLARTTAGAVVIAMQGSVAVTTARSVASRALAGSLAL